MLNSISKLDLAKVCPNSIARHIFFLALALVLAIPAKAAPQEMPTGSAFQSVLLAPEFSAAANMQIHLQSNSEVIAEVAMIDAGAEMAVWISGFDPETPDGTVLGTITVTEQSAQAVYRLEMSGGSVLVVMADL